MGGILLLLACVLAGCGTSKEEEAQEPEIGIDGYVYVPEYLDFDMDEYMNNMRVVGTTLYYTTYQWDEQTGEGKEKFYSIDLLQEPLTAKELPMEYGDAQDSWDLMTFLPDNEGNLLLFLRDYSQNRMSDEGYSIADIYVAKYGPDGKELFTKDISSYFEGESYVYISNVAIDAQDHVYVLLDSGIYLMDGQGEVIGKVESDNYLNNMGKDAQGKVYCTLYGDNGMELREVDFAAKKLGEPYQGFPDTYGSIGPGMTEDFMAYDEEGVFEYDLETQTKKPVLKWLESDIYGDQVEEVVPLGEGKLLAVTYDYGENGRGTEFAVLTKQEKSVLLDKEIITIGTIYMDSELLQMAVDFNKGSGQYRIDMKVYMDSDAMNAQDYETAYNEAMTAFNNDILSSSGPDMVNVSYLDNISNYTAKGAIEDLSPYLDASETVHREDYFESVLDAYTFDGTLVCIPTAFEINTVVGRASQVGTKMGWTMDDMMEVVRANPDVLPFGDVNKSEILSMCLMYGKDDFIDWEQKTCSLDSEAFRTVLEFVNEFPDEYEWDPEASTESKIADGKILFYAPNIYDASSISHIPQIFGGEEVTYIGFPTSDGSVGCALHGQGGEYAILANSKHKEGAWAFIEHILEEDAKGRNTVHYWGFASNKNRFEERIKDDLDEEPYQKDENGELVLDEDGNPVRASHGWSEGGDGFRIYDYVPLPEEVELLRELIDTATPRGGTDEEIEKIILEEAAPYFQGQKSVEEVTGIIQSRVGLYLSEGE